MGPIGAVTIVRAYADADYAACRVLWAELTSHHREIYEDPTIGGADPGAGVDEAFVNWPVRSSGAGLPVR